MITGCSEEQTTISTDEEMTELTKNYNWDQAVDVVALDINEKLKYPEFRELLKSEVLRQFDGDYNILLRSMVARQSKYLDYYRNKGKNYKTTNNSNDLPEFLKFETLAQISEKYPQMQVAVQVHAEKWDAEHEIPSIVFVTTDFDEATHDYVEGYNNNGEKIKVSTLEDPEENYVVVSFNERTSFNDQNELVLSNTNNKVTNFEDDTEFAPNFDFPDPCPPEDPTCGGGGGGGGSSHPQYNGTGHNGQLPSLIATHSSTLTSTFNAFKYDPTADIDSLGEVNGQTFYRGDDTYEIFRSYKINDINEIEEFVNGAPELYVVEFVPEVGNPTVMLQILQARHEPDNRNEINGQWWDCPADEIHLWEWQETGTSVTIGMYEYDKPAIGENVDQKTLSSDQTTIVDELVLNSDGTYSITRSRTYTTANRYLEMKSRKSEYIGIEKISVFNKNDQFLHSRGVIDYKSWPELP